MRVHCVCLVAILTIVPSTVWAASDGIPTLDVRPVCRGIAGQSADPGVGQRNQTETFQQCMESVQAVREQLKQEWSAFSAADKRHCVSLATTGGESSNTELLTCLEMARASSKVRFLRKRNYQARIFTFDADGTISNDRANRINVGLTAGADIAAHGENKVGRANDERFRRVIFGS
jgi:hypothetical protein